jgi:hypothetical protein
MTAKPSPKQRQNVVSKPARTKARTEQSGRTGSKDDVTEDTIEKRNKLVSEEEFKDFETISGAPPPRHGSL